jgi:hypothetical protein
MDQVNRFISIETSLLLACLKNVRTVLYGIRSCDMTGRVHRTFGCSHNISDSEYMAGLLSQYGYTLLDDNERDLADLWLVNTCTVCTPMLPRMDYFTVGKNSIGVV